MHLWGWSFTYFCDVIFFLVLIPNLDLAVRTLFLSIFRSLATIRLLVDGSLINRFFIFRSVGLVRAVGFGPDFKLYSTRCSSVHLLITSRIVWSFRPFFFEVFYGTRSIVLVTCVIIDDTSSIFLALFGLHDEVRTRWKVDRKLDDVQKNFSKIFFF